MYSNDKYNYAMQECENSAGKKQVIKYQKIELINRVLKKEK